jgi:tetratricopeptide (TPR) repeat protein
VLEEPRPLISIGAKVNTCKQPERGISRNTESTRPPSSGAPIRVQSRLKRAFRGLLLLAILEPYFFVAQQPDVYARAQQAFTEGHFREAADLFAAAAAAESGLQPNPHPDSRLMQAKSLINLDEAAAAELVLRNFLEQDPRSSAGLYLLGYALERENKPRESLEIFTRAAAIAAPRAEDLRLVALDYVLLDDYVDAIHWLNRALASDPANAEAWYDFGRAQMHQGNFVESERAFKRTLAINPLHAKALDNLGLSYEGQNRTEDALQAYSRAIEAQKKSQHPTEQPLLNFGALLNTKNRSAEAIASLQQAVALAPSSSRCHEELSRAYAGAHQDDLAREQMERAVALDPDNPRLHFQLGQMYRRAGFLDRAQVELKKSAELYSTHSSTTEDLGRK